MSEELQTSAEQVATSRRATQDVIDLFAPAVRHVVDFINKRDLPGVAKVPPKDPRERALWLRDNRNTGPAKPHNRRHQMSKRFCMWVDVEPSDNVIYDGGRLFVLGDSTAPVQQSLGKGWQPVGFANEIPATFRAGKS